MFKRKWIINFSALFVLLCLFFLMSGSYHEDCQQVSVPVGEETEMGTVTLYLADETSNSFKAFSIADSTVSDISVFVEKGKDVEVSGKVYIDYDGANVSAENHTVSVDENTGNIFYASVLNDKSVITGDFSLTCNGTANETFTISVKYSADGVTTEIYTKTVNVFYVDYLICPECGAEIKADGTFTHTSCGGCYYPCVDGVVEHAECEICGGKCIGEGIVHGKCGGCGASCVDGVITHAQCEICGGKCTGDGIVHGKCDGCGASCVDGTVTHAECEACGGKCTGDGIVHGKCDGCGASCVDGTVTHAECETCGGKCIGDGIVHAEDCKVANPPETSDSVLWVICLALITSAVSLIIVLKKRAQN